MFRGVTKPWKNKAPMKIRILMWLAILDRLQTRVNLKKKKWKGNRNCCLYGIPQTTEHIFFNCEMAKTVWACFKRG